MEQWKRASLWDESCFMLFPASDLVYLWQTPSQAYDEGCLLSRVKHCGCSVFILRSHMMVFHGPHDYSAKSHYWQELCDHFGQSCPFHGTIFLFNRDAVFQDDNILFHTSPIIQNWFCDNERYLSHLLYPSQSLDLKIIELL